MKHQNGKRGRFLFSENGKRGRFLFSENRKRGRFLFFENGKRGRFLFSDFLRGGWLTVGQNVPSGDAVACGHLSTHNLGEKGENKEPLPLITELQWFTFFYLPSGRDYFFLRLP